MYAPGWLVSVLFTERGNIWQTKNPAAPPRRRLVSLQLLMRKNFRWCPPTFCSAVLSCSHHHCPSHRTTTLITDRTLGWPRAPLDPSDDQGRGPVSANTPCRPLYSEPIMLGEKAPAHSCGQHIGLCGGRLLARRVVRHAGSGGVVSAQIGESDWTATIKPAGPPRCPTSSLVSSFCPTVSAQSILESPRTDFSLLICIHLQPPSHHLSAARTCKPFQGTVLPPDITSIFTVNSSRLTCRISLPPIPGPVHRFHPGYNDSCSCASTGKHA